MQGYSTVKQFQIIYCFNVTSILEIESNSFWEWSREVSILCRYSEYLCKLKKDFGAMLLLYVADQSAEEHGDLK